VLKQCPRVECNAFFKVNSEDWKNIVKDEEVFCPFCRNNSKASEYLPNDQTNEVVGSIRKSILNHWNHGYSIAQNITTLNSQEEYELNITCDKCQVRFSVIGTAYFCPSCGFNSVEKSAKESVEKIILKAEKSSIIQNSLEQSLTKDDAAIVVKTIIENSLSDCIGTLQSYSEMKYNNISQTKAPFNAFQNLEIGNRLWVSLKGEGYDNWLTAAELEELTVSIHRRHLLEHKGGIVDKKYIQKSCDKKYIEGDRIVVRPNDIIGLGEIVLKIINRIRDF
jgi:uncharacterized Zn finger protein (UPF0148 family)